MGKLYLVSCFHGNLLSSTIPESQYSRILDRCYWPVLELTEKHGIKLGIEFPAHSLTILDTIDTSFVRRIRSLASSGLVEFVGSGYVQAIQPLLPEEVNRANLALGNEHYRDLLGTVPAVAYLNEQVISGGTGTLYRQAGYQAVIMDYDNCRLACDYVSDHRYQVCSDERSGIRLLWNSAIAFQRFQRYIYGLVPLDEYLAYILSHYNEQEDRVFMFYGSDWEIIDYKPGDIDLYYVDTSDEVKRLDELFSALTLEAGMNTCLPSEALSVAGEHPAVPVASAAHPLPCKKQAKYNVTRWAACGRDNSKSNTECYRLFRDIANQASLRDADADKEDTRRLLELFSSDYRTFTTEQKYQQFQARLGNLRSELEDRLSAAGRKTNTRTSVSLENPLPFDWDSYPFAFTVCFPEGAFSQLPAVLGQGKPIPAQLEEVQLYRDGSIRSATVIAAPSIPSGATLKLDFSTTDIPDHTPDIPPASVELMLNNRKGGTIQQLTFPGLAASPFIGEIEHHEYNDIRVSTDQFSGHMLLFTRDGQKIVDLGAPEKVHREENGPVRETIRVKIKTQLGTLWKTYYVYKTFPRVDLRYHFQFTDLQPLSFRLGTLTFFPETFDRASLAYATVNGTTEIERFRLSGETINHGAPVALDVSSHYCLGATEGWISIGDDRKGLAVITDKSELYTVPMIEYREIHDRPYLRLYHSVAETDATSQPFWRGHNQITFTLLGHGNDLDGVRKQATAINRGLIVQG